MEYISDLEYKDIVDNFGSKDSPRIDVISAILESLIYPECCNDLDLFNKVRLTFVEHMVIMNEEQGNLGINVSLHRNLLDNTTNPESTPMLNLVNYFGNAPRLQWCYVLILEKQKMYSLNKMAGIMYDFG